jgi:hypothetical protein
MDDDRKALQAMTLPDLKNLSRRAIINFLVEESGTRGSQKL